MNLEGKKFIVTGGSRGIGQGTVRILTSLGAKVAFTHTGSGDVAEIPGAKGYILNLADTAKFKESVGQMVESLGGLDGVVNNAGIAIDNLMLRVKEEDFDKTVSINLRGTYFFTKECLRPLMKTGGSIVFVSSVVGLMGNTGQTVYAATKAGLIGLAKSLAKELASRQVRVNLVAPGFIETDMTATLGTSIKETLSKGIPMERLGTTEDIGHAIAYLLSDTSRYVTGQVLNISGGLYI